MFYTRVRNVYLTKQKSNYFYFGQQTSVFFLHLTQKMFCKNCRVKLLFFICEICRQNFFLLQINNTMIKGSHMYTLIGYNNAYLNTSTRSYPTFDHPDHSTPCTVIFWSAILSISRLYNFITMPRKNSNYM